MKREREQKEFDEMQQRTDCENCQIAGGTGQWKIPAHLNADGYYESSTLKICKRRTQCEKIPAFRNRYLEVLKKNSGMSEELLSKRLTDFKPDLQWQRNVKNLAGGYLFEKVNSNNWFFLLGGSGSGKTHIAASICNELLNNGQAVKYINYQDLIRSMRNFDYAEFEAAEKAPVLFLDDLYKHEPTEEEKRRTFELIEYRYRNNLKTIITTERQKKDLIRIDEATTGRIVEKCGRYWHALPFKLSNQRLKRFLEDKKEQKAA
jgi:DNA replication protein DnaC